jgi:hypothetical protein
MSDNNRKHINDVYTRSKEPWHDLWKWAVAPDGPKEKEERFHALYTWSREKGKKARKRNRFNEAKAFVGAKIKYRKKFRFFEEKVDKNAEKKAQNPSVSGITMFDGKPVASWIVPWLLKARANGWRGYVMSGYRTPEYSESLCYGICGNPSCPGRCAGRTSGHSQKVFPRGCVDCTDYLNLANIFVRIGAPLKNNLPVDRPHFSNSGF